MGGGGGGLAVPHIVASGRHHHRVLFERQYVACRDSVERRSFTRRCRLGSLHRGAMVKNIVAYLAVVVLGNLPSARPLRVIDGDHVHICPEAGSNA